MIAWWWLIPALLSGAFVGGIAGMVLIYWAVAAERIGQ